MTMMIRMIEYIALLASVITLPFSDARFPILGVPFSPHEIGIMAATLCAFVVGRIWSGYRLRIVIGIALFLAGFAISTIAGGVDRTALGIVKSWVVFPIILAALLSARLRQDRFRRRLFEALTAAGAVVIALALFGEYTYDGRLRGMDISPNVLAMTAAPLALPALFLAYSGYRERRRHHLLSGAGVSLGVAVVVIATGSASAIVSLVAGVSVFVAGIGCTARFFRAVFISAIALPALGLAILTIPHWNDYGSGEVRSSTASRVMIWNSAAAMLVEHPFVGIGPGNFQETYLRLQQRFPPYLEWAVPHPHNVFFTFWLYAGAIGLAGFLVILVETTRMASASLTARDTGSREVGAVVSGYIALFVVGGLADTTYFRSDYAALFWIIVAVALSTRTRWNPEKKNAVIRSASLA